MKKKFIYSFMIAAAAAAFSSCSNFLEERPTDAVSYTHLTLPTT